MKTLAKNYTCLCGHVKDIKWIDPFPFVFGKVDFCVGYSECDKCGKLQTHYSGSPEGLLEFEEFMVEQGMKP